MQLGTADDASFYMDQCLADVYSTTFWFTFVRTAEKRLAEAGVRTRGVADGDLLLPTCVYASLRNEAFCKDPAQAGTPNENELVYPPNVCGWNAADELNPFLDVIFFLSTLAPFICKISQHEIELPASSRQTGEAQRTQKRDLQAE